MIKHILLDLDGTLTDPKVGITTSARYGLNKVGHPIAEDLNIDWIIGPPLKASLAKLLNVTVDDVLAEQALLGYRERFAVKGLYENHLFADVEPTLKKLTEQGYSQTTLLFIQDSKKTRNNSSTESINHSLRLRLTHAHICSIGFKSGLYAGSQRILCPCCSNNS